MNDNRSEKLLLPDEPKAFECIHFGSRPVLICCEHASNRVPKKLNNLGLSEELLQTHIAWDIGAGDLSVQIAKNLNATSVRNNYSRLVVDCNRNLYDPTAFIELNDQIIIKGNVGLDTLQKKPRVDEIYHPYHSALNRELQTHVNAEQVPVMIAIHSFTPRLRKQNPRPWHVGILWDKDPRIPVPLLKALSADVSINVGDNEPYSGRHFADFSIDQHAELNGFAHVCIEVRQDLLEKASGIQEWSERLSNILNEILIDKNLYTRINL